MRFFSSTVSRSTKQIEPTPACNSRAGSEEPMFPRPTTSTRRDRRLLSDKAFLLLRLPGGVARQSRGVVAESAGRRVRPARLRGLLVAGGALVEPAATAGALNRHAVADRPAADRADG